MDHPDANQHLDRPYLSGHLRNDCRISPLHVCIEQVVSLKNILRIRVGAARHNCSGFLRSRRGNYLEFFGGRGVCVGRGACRCPIALQDKARSCRRMQRPLRAGIAALRLRSNALKTSENYDCSRGIVS